MVLAHLMQALSASRPRSDYGTQGILISYCVMRILMKSLRSAYGCYHQRGFMASIVRLRMMTNSSVSITYVSKQRCPFYPRLPHSGLS